jgi:hypothetical protein
MYSDIDGVTIVNMALPTDPIFESHEQCMYREARTMVEGDGNALTSSRYIINVGGLTSQELMRAFAGYPLSIDGVHDYCKLKCPFSDCEYNSRMSVS